MARSYASADVIPVARLSCVAAASKRFRYNFSSRPARDHRVNSWPCGSTRASSKKPTINSHETHDYGSVIHYMLMHSRDACRKSSKAAAIKTDAEEMEH